MNLRLVPVRKEDIPKKGRYSYVRNLVTQFMDSNEECMKLVLKDAVEGKSVDGTIRGFLMRFPNDKIRVSRVNNEIFFRRL